MSKDTFDPVSVIGDWLGKELKPGHHVSPAVLEFRVQQLEAERAELISQLAIMTEQCEHWSPVDGIKAQRQIKDARALLAKLGEK